MCFCLCIQDARSKDGSGGSAPAINDVTSKNDTTSRNENVLNSMYDDFDGYNDNNNFNDDNNGSNFNRGTQREYLATKEYSKLLTPYTVDIENKNNDDGDDCARTRGFNPHKNVRCFCKLFLKVWFL